MTDDENMELMRLVKEIHAKVMSGPTARASAPVGDVAPDSELDGKFGNQAVRKDPPRWVGPSFVGKTYSECPPEYLDSLAGFFDWKAGKDDEKGTDDGAKYARFARLDAARARGWSKRIRAGWAPTAPPDETDLPF